MCIIGPKTREKLSVIQSESWVGAMQCEEDYITHTNLFSTAASLDNSTKQLVYLTSDAEETLETLDPSCAYIIGGIVDRNRLKGITHKKAIAQGIRTAKLPIREHMQLFATHVLTVNHVVLILLNYAKCQNWPEALKSVIPERKLSKEGKLEKRKRKAKENSDGESEDEEEGEEEGEGEGEEKEGEGEEKEEEIA